MTFAIFSQSLFSAADGSAAFQLKRRLAHPLVVMLRSARDISTFRPKSLAKEPFGAARQ